VSAVLDTLSSMLGGTSAPAAVRAPRAEVSFGSGSPEDWAKVLVSLTVEAAAAPAVGAVEIVVAPRAPAAAVGDTGSVKLGFGDDGPSDVFTGAIHAVHRNLDGSMRIVAADGAAPLAALRMNQSYEQLSAGRIVSDLASQVGVSVRAEDGPSLPFYVVDDGRSAWSHVDALARLSGFVAACTPAGRLGFGPAADGDPVQTFSYGGDVLSLESFEAPPAAGAVTAIGEGAAGSQGSDAWNWLVKDPSGVTGTSGSGAPARLVTEAALRSSDAAQGAADAVAAAAKAGATTARLLVPGAPKAVVGSAVAVKGAPDAALNGTWVVRGLRHRYTKRGGYTTLLLVTKSGGGAGGLAGGLAGALGGLL
jgi:phage protein D